MLSKPCIDKVSNKSLANPKPFLVIFCIGETKVFWIWIVDKYVYVWQKVWNIYKVYPRVVFLFFLKFIVWILPIKFFAPDQSLHPPPKWDLMRHSSSHFSLLMPNFFLQTFCTVCLWHECRRTEKKFVYNLSIPIYRDSGM